MPGVLKGRLSKSRPFYSTGSFGSLSDCTVSWRGNGNDGPASGQYAPKVFTLSAGPHELIIRGREANTTIGTITIAATVTALGVGLAPDDTGGPRGPAELPQAAVSLSVTGQPDQAYDLLFSQDLQTWSVLGTVRLYATGAWHFTQSGPPSLTNGFYRLQEQ